jgi:phage terminase large subunit-like protein
VPAAVSLPRGVTAEQGAGVVAGILATILAERRAPARSWTPLPHQIPPDGDWQVWLMEGGRGSGKTDGAAHYLDQHVNGPACLPGFRGGHRPAIIAPTLGDALEACVNGPSGLKAHNPGVVSVQAAGGTFVRWPNGAEAKVFGAYTPEDVERLRAGGNRCIVWAEELAAWARLADAWDQMKFGLRLGPSPRVVVSSTPKPHKKYVAIRSDPRTVRTGASTAMNPHLNAGVRSDLEARYAGTRLGRQELDAEILTDVPGALWTYAMLEDRRSAPDLARCVVGVDPSGGKDAENDEQGIIIGGKGVDGHGYVVADRSCKLSPDGWGRRAVQAYVDFTADAIVVERNFGGDMAESVVKAAAAAMDVRVKVVMVTASRGKALRAQPVAALYEQGLMHHADVFPELEEQQTTWTPESGTSPDRLDALVWMVTETMLDAQPPAASAESAPPAGGYHADRRRRL